MRLDAIQIRTQQLAAGGIQRRQAARTLVFYPAMVFDLLRWFDGAALGALLGKCGGGGDS